MKNKKVERYDWSYNGMDCNSDGRYVYYEDYLKLKKKLEETEKDTFASFVSNTFPDLGKD